MSLRSPVGALDPNNTRAPPTRLQQVLAAGVNRQRRTGSCGCEKCKEKEEEKEGEKTEKGEDEEEEE